MKSESERFGFFCCLFLPHHKMVRFWEKLWLDFISPVAKEVKSVYNDTYENRKDMVFFM